MPLSRIAGVAGSVGLFLVATGPAPAAAAGPALAATTAPPPPATATAEPLAPGLGPAMSAVSPAMREVGAAVRGIAPTVHTRLLASEPEDGAELDEPPDRIRLLFSATVDPEAARITLVGVDGSDPLSPGRDPEEPRALVAPVAPLTAGRYRVDWQVVSVDGHVVRGSIAFRVAPPESTPAAVAAEAGMEDTARTSPASEAEPYPPPPTEGAGSDRVPIVAASLRGLGVGALMGLAGLLAFIAWIAPAPGRSTERLATILAVLAPLLLGAHYVVWAGRVDPAAGVGALIDALGTEPGRLEGLRIGGSVLGLWALALARRPGLAAAFTLAAVAVSGAIGHARAIDPLWSIPAKSVHLLAAALWLGGLLYLLAGPARPDAFRAGAARVSAVALVAVLVVAVTGLAQTLLLVPQPMELLASSYGALSGAKVAGLAALVAFGARNRLRILPRLSGGEANGGEALRRSVLGETLVMVVVLIVAGFLAYTPPPGG